MNNTAIKLLVGDPVADPVELRLIKRLRTDLERRGVPAAMYANFFPNAWQRRQIDLLVRTDVRTAHVEIKGLNPEYPVRGGQNGEWVQVLPGEEERSLGKNCGRQARDGTYAISDAMRKLARDGRATPCDSDFFRHIDSIVAIWETVPNGSDIDTPDYVTVMGYSELVDRLAEPGRTVPWSDDDWDEFARYHGLYQPEEESESKRQRRDSLAMADDYRLNAQMSLTEGLGPLVDLGAAGTDGNTLTADDVDRRVAGGGAVAIVGPSGSGKSHLAKHLAVSHCGAGRMVVWAQASDYTKGQFGQLLARAVGPFSAEPWRNLIGAAEEAGVAITIVVDGLNECPEDDRAELLRRLRAFTQQHPAGVLVTSTNRDGLSGTLGADTINPSKPDRGTRKAILDVYGARRPERISSQFRTPHELSIAAECENELSESATIAELHDAYIRRHAPTETLRSGMRALATRLHTRLRTSMPLSEAASVLASDATGFDARQTDDVLGCPLLEIGRHRIRFRHELLGQHLAAEQLVRAAHTGSQLGETLGAPANRSLAKAALGIESDGSRVWEALQALCVANLITSAVSGEFGPETRQKATGGIFDVLRAGVAAAESGGAAFEGIHPGTLEGVEYGRGRWVAERRWGVWGVYVVMIGARLQRGAGRCGLAAAFCRGGLPSVGLFRRVGRLRLTALAFLVLLLVVGCVSGDSRAPVVGSGSQEGVSPTPEVGGRTVVGGGDGGSGSQEGVSPTPEVGGRTVVGGGDGGSDLGSSAGSAQGSGPVEDVGDPGPTVGGGAADVTPVWGEDLPGALYLLAPRRRIEDAVLHLYEVCVDRDSVSARMSGFWLSEGDEKTISDLWDEYEVKLQRGSVPCDGPEEQGFVPLTSSPGEVFDDPVAALEDFFSRHPDLGVSFYRRWDSPSSPLGHFGGLGGRMRQVLWWGWMGDQVHVLQDSVSVRDGVVRGLVANTSRTLFARDVTVTARPAVPQSETGDGGGASGRWPLTVQPAEMAPFEIDGWAGSGDPSDIVFEVAASWSPDPDLSRSLSFGQDNRHWSGAETFRYEAPDYVYEAEKHKIPDHGQLGFHILNVGILASTSHPSLAEATMSQTIPDLGVHIAFFNEDGTVYDVVEPASFFETWTEEGGFDGQPANSLPTTINGVQRNSFRVIFLFETGFWHIWAGGAHPPPIPQPG